MRFSPTAALVVLLAAFHTAPFRALAAGELSPEALRADTALQTKVSFEVKAQPFATFLSDLSAQGNVKLAVAPELEIAKRLLTARVRELSLAEVMASLSKLYNLNWVQEGDGFRAVAGGRNPVEKRVEQIGRWYRYWTPDRKYFPTYLTRRPLANRYEPLKEKTQILEKLWPFLRGVDPRKGVALTALPVDLQDRFRYYVENDAGGSLLSTLRAARMEQVMTGTLKVTPPPLLFRNAQGQFVPDLSNGMLVARIESPGQDRLEWQLIAPKDPRRTPAAGAPARPNGAP